VYIGRAAAIQQQKYLQLRDARCR